MELPHLPTTPIIDHVICEQSLILIPDYWCRPAVDLLERKRISGHKNRSLVEHYGHQNGAHIWSAMDKFADRYKTKPEFDASGAQFSPTPSNGAGFRAAKSPNA
jgi:hypothetical protein